MAGHMHFLDIHLHHAFFEIWSWDNTDPDKKKSPYHMFVKKKLV